MNVDTLLSTYQVDLGHARHVADMSLALFDAVRERYGLPAEARRLVELGGLLHNVGLTTDPPAHHLVGRDIVLRQLLDDLSPREQALVACIVAFHRKKVRPQLEPAFLSLGKKGQSLALRLAAIVRVGDGLDYSQSQTTRLAALEPRDGGLALLLSGPHAAQDGARAVAKADLWRKQFDDELALAGEGDQPLLTPVEADGAPGEDAAPALTPWYAAPETPLAELGRVLLRRYLRRMRAAEREVRADESIEAVHALRVATRRLRSTLRLLAPVAPSGMRSYAKGVSRLARVAGAVRDYDVLLADLGRRAAELPETLRPGLEALTEELAARRKEAHAALIDRLDSAEHAGFVRAFAAVMNDSAGWENGPRVRDLAGSTIWRHYEALRAHAHGGLPAEEAELHLMRIEGKRMRYMLELFSDTFGDRLDQAVTPLVAFQDHLGAMQDVAVAQETLAAVGGGEAWAAAQGYLALRLHEAEQRRAELPARWDKLAGGTYRRKLMELIVRL